MAEGRWRKVDSDQRETLVGTERILKLVFRAADRACLPSDLWDLSAQWGNAGEAGRDHPPRGPQPQWVQELIKESQEKHLEKSRALIDGLGYATGESDEEPLSYAGPIRALPRSIDQIGSGLDSSEFWSTFGITPDVPWVD
jgi:hypothetical protein